MNQAVETIRAATNPRLVLLGYLRTMYSKRTALHIAFSAAIEERFPGLLFENFIPDANPYREAIVARKPVSFFKPRIEASKAVGRIVDELEARILRLTNPAAPAEVKEVA